MQFKRFIPYFFLINLGALVIMFTSQCYYDSEEHLFPELQDLCDTTNITFSGAVQPVLSQYCLSCHSNTTAPSLGANIKLEDYSDVLIRAENGSLIGTISHSGAYSPMPKGAGKLSDCIISNIQKWIDDGSPNN